MISNGRSSLQPSCVASHNHTEGIAKAPSTIWMYEAFESSFNLISMKIFYFMLSISKQDIPQIQKNFWGRCRCWSCPIRPVSKQTLGVLHPLGDRFHNDLQAAVACMKISIPSEASWAPAYCFGEWFQCQTDHQYLSLDKLEFRDYTTNRDATAAHITRYIYVPGYSLWGRAFQQGGMHATFKRWSLIDAVESAELEISSTW